MPITLIDLTYLIIRAFNGVKVVETSLALDAGEAFLVVIPALGRHLFGLEDLE